MASPNPPTSLLLNGREVSYESIQQTDNPHTILNGYEARVLLACQIRGPWLYLVLATGLGRLCRNLAVPLGARVPWQQQAQRHGACV